MSITNTSKPTTSITNNARARSSETWESITTTWATETRSWIACSSGITNTARASAAITNVAKPS